MSTVQRRNYGSLGAASNAYRNGLNMARRSINSLFSQASARRQGTIQRMRNVAQVLIPPVAVAGTLAAGARRVMTPRNIFQTRTQGTPRTRARANARHVTSNYQGKFKKAKRNKSDPFVKNGFKHVTEVTGLVTDPDCCYIGHSTCPSYTMIEMACQALLRKLFEKAGLVINALADPLLHTSTNTTAGWLIRVNTVDLETGAATAIADYPTAIGDSIARIVGQDNAGLGPAWPALLTYFQQYGAMNTLPTAININEPLNMILYNNVGDGAPIYVQVAQLNLREENIVCSVVSEIKIQNRSVSATGNEDAESVSNNPLRYVKYLFDGIPRHRDKQTSLKLPPTKTGVITIGSVNSGNNYMREPPSPKLFWNCKKSISGVLQPGAIKSDKLTFYKSMKLLKFLKYHAVYQSDDRDPGPGFKFLSKELKGPFGLFAFEDMINLNAAQRIAVAYEVNRSIGVYSTTRRVKFASGAVYSLTQDDAPP